MRIVGVLNVTPDSFSDGGRFLDPRAAVDHALKLAADGADIIDIGGESTRPGAVAISAGEEIERILPVIAAIRCTSQIPLSIDTMKAIVAERAIAAGATMINDVSAGRDPDMLPLVAARRVPICLVHMRGTPATMQRDTHYDDVVAEVRDFLAAAINRALAAGVQREHIIVDPGIGFGKSAQDNVVLLRRLAELQSLGAPILIGTSRKSFMGKLLGHALDLRIEATLATLAYARQQGVSFFRVHDVAAARRYLDMVRLLEGG